MPQLNVDKVITLASPPLPLPSPVSHFYFVRHGQTPRNALKIFQSYAEPLSDIGRAQAIAAAAALAAHQAELSPESRIASLVVSDAARTLETASPIAKSLGLEAKHTPMLRERDFGGFVGSSSETIDWALTPPPGATPGETLEAFVRRTREGLVAALAHQAEHEHEGLRSRPTVIVAHGGNLLVIAASLGVPLDREAFGNALPIKFHRQDGRWSAVVLQEQDGRSTDLS